MSRLRQVLVTLPPRTAYEREVSEQLEVDPGESAAWCGQTTRTSILLPAAVWSDILDLADASGWTVEEVLGYLILQGAMRLVERGTPL